MICAAVQPQDLSILADDPFDGLEPAGPDAAWRSFSLLEPRIFCSKLFRTLGPYDTEAAALWLGARLVEGAYAGLVLDYRGATIKVDPAASAALAEASAAAFPRGILVGFLGDGPSAPFTRLMATLMRDRGVKAAHAGDFDTLFDAMTARLSIPAE